MSTIDTVGLMVGVFLLLIGFCMAMDALAESSYRQRRKEREIECEREYEQGNQDPWN